MRVVEKQQVLSIDENRIKEDIKEIFETTPKTYNYLISSTESYLGFELSEEQKRSVLKRKVPAVLQILKDKYNMPTAKDEIILGIHNKDIKPLHLMFNKYRSVKTSNLDRYYINKTGFVAPKELIDEIRENNTYYIKNSKQSTVFKHAKLIADAINNARKEKAIRMPSTSHLTTTDPRYKIFGSLNDFLKDQRQGDEHIVVPDLEKIYRIRE
ncbi:MAG: hypothetical protein ABJJ05_15080 [Maribacter litoralis]|uniref:hypothetical protein n=1 Tax=Maribacter litoralis TaxID=2059726 RepID=UPI0032992F44